MNLGANASTQFDAVAEPAQQIPAPPQMPAPLQIQPPQVIQPQPVVQPIAAPEPPPTQEIREVAAIPPSYKGSGIATPDITISHKQSTVLRGDRDYYILESPNNDCTNQKVICLPSGRVYFIMSMPTASEIENQKKNLQNIGMAEPQAYQQMEIPFKW
jgi:hypothetical protein